MKPELIRSQAESVIHRARWVMADPNTIYENGFVRAENHRIVEVGSGPCQAQGKLVDHGSGVLMPQVINAHTHLELCALRGKLSYENGFRAWVRDLIFERQKLGSQVLTEGVDCGIAQILESGCAAVGEISSLGLSFGSFLNSGLDGVWFQEVLGSRLPQGNWFDFTRNPASVSLAGHGPHTTAPEILKALKTETDAHRRLFSIHIAESEDEAVFIRTAKGPWANFLIERGIDYSTWGLPAQSPVRHLDRLGLLGERTLAVHLIDADENDFEILARCKAHVCICPRSNQNLHGRMADPEAMIRAGINPCLGTDSLASVNSLSIFDEMAFLSKAFESLSPAEILAMATINGAKALGVSYRLGSLEPGKKGQLLYLPIAAANASDLLQKIVAFSERKLP